MKTLRRILFTSPVRALWLCAILLVSCATAARGPLEQDPAVRSGVLANGLTYRILRNTQPGNRLFLRLVVKAGSVLEDDDQRGLAHLVEHMAFKNTAHFAENELIKYFESIGMAFGPDVNAYTSYDQTVYMLEIPADSGEALDTALTVIGDWAWGVTFEEEALQKERDVVIEEWRLDRGFSGRVQDAILPFLFQGSRYADRATIGVPEVIKNAPRERIVDFYETWYRTNLLTVLIVGDADPDVIEGAVREKLSEIPEDSAIHRKKAARPEYPVPLSRDEAALVITDPESPYPMAQLYEFFPARPVRSRGDFKNRLLRQVASDILGERLNERAEQGAPFLRAGSSFYHLIRPLWAGSTAFIPREGQFEGAFKAVLDEMDRFRAFGVTQGELDRQKQNQLAWADQAWQNRDKTESSALIGALIGSELYGEPFLSPEARHELVGSLIGEISVKEVNRTIASYFGSRGKFLIVTAPEDSPLPPAAEIEDLWKNYRSKTPLAPPQDDGDGRPLFSPPPDFAPGKVVSEEIFSFDAGDSPRAVTAFTLSNGARVVLCPTDFKANSFLFTALDRGGSSLLGDEDALSAAKAPDYLELSGLNGFPQAEVGKKLAGTQITIYPQITQSYAALTGSAASSDLETYFQLINLYFSAPYFTESAWDRLISDARNDAGARKSSPEAVFVDEVLAYIYGPSVRFKNLTEETIGLLRADRAEKAYRDFFANPGDFTFVFTGDLSLETLRDLSARYIGSLPAAPASASEARAVAPSFPKGRTVLRVRKGLDAQGEVLIVAGDEKPPQVADIPVEQELVAMAENLAQVRLREALREKTGGVYGVSVGISLWNYPARRFLTQIFFGCDPDRAERLAAITEEEMGKLRDAPPAAEEIAMLRETFVRQRETARRENDFWHNALVRNIAGNRARDSFAAEDAVLKALTPETLRRICGIYLNTENAVTGILTPE